MSAVMSNSGQKINYAVRPCKSIERKMMRDVLSRLFVFYPLQDYEYVGFGSKYFTDFILFHKTLNISKMISLEHDVHNEDRYIFNKPYKCIDIHFEKSSDWLVRTQLNDPSIVWLDYDGIYQQSMTDDLFNLAAKLQHGSVFAISFNYTAPKLELLQGKYKDHTVDVFRQHFESIFGSALIDPNLIGRGLTEKEFYLKELIVNITKVINKALLERNELIDENANKLTINRLFNFTYRDGAPMATLGWLIIENDHLENFNRMRLDEFEFVELDTNNLSPYNIDPANLTIREIRYLNEVLVSTEDALDVDQKKHFTDAEIEMFRKLYKYFPTFTEIEAY